MRRSAIAERVQHATEALFDFLRRMAGDGEGADHDVRPMVADGAGTQFRAVADDVVLERLDGQRILRVQRLQPALRQAEGVVAEIDLAGFLVQLEHREIGDPAEAERSLLDQPELFPEPRAHQASEFRGRVAFAGSEEHRVADAQAAAGADRFGAFRFQIAGNGAFRAVFVEHDVAEATGALGFRPVVQLVEEAPRLRGPAGCRDRAHDAA